MYPLAVELVERVRREHFADERMTLAEVHVVQAHDELRLKGAVLDHHGAELFVSALRCHAPDLNWHDELMPLIAGPDYGWALVPQAVCDLRREPAMHSERISQAVFGEAVEVLRCHGDWVLYACRTAIWAGCTPVHCGVAVLHRSRPGVSIVPIS